jgi:carotenoid cleavage dioxygenase-like enzyme
MGTKFPDLPIYRGFDAPGRVEADILDLEVEGEVPTGIDGAFFRVAPDPQWPPRLGDDIYFNGDGMVCQFRFHRGHVDFKSRYARTDKFVVERKARKALFGAYRNPYSDDPAVAGMIRGTANTNVVVHGGRLLALKEDSPAFAMDPGTLESKGYWTADGKISSQTFTAHPKLDPETGEMIAFGYAARGICTPDIAYYVIDKSGKVKREVYIAAPYYCMIHDFAVTRDQVVFPVVPIVGDLESLKAGRVHFNFDPSKEVYLGVLPRDGEAKDVRWFKGHNRFASHIMNAFTDGRRLRIDIPVAKGNMFPFFPDIAGKPFDPVAAQSYLSRWTIDLDANDDTFEETRLTDLCGEFPRIDDRYAMAPYRHGYVCVFDMKRPVTRGDGKPVTGMAFNAIGHIDHATGKSEAFYAPPASAFQEPVFVPKRDGAAEGEGWLVGLLNRYDEMRTDLVVLDAERLPDGPIATVRLPMRLRPGLHGNWVPAAQLGAA